MIQYENEIKRMNVWEKVVQVSNDVGYISSDIEQAKIEIAKKMASYGLVLIEVEEGKYKLVNIHDTNDCIETIGAFREEVLLNLFSVTIVQKVKAVEPKPVQAEAKPKQEVKTFVPNQSFKVTNTPQEAVARVNEVKANEVYVNEMHDYIVSKIGMTLKLAKTDDIVSPNRPKTIFGKLKTLDWDKKDFRKAMNAILGLNNFETQMSNDQCTQIIKFLEQEEIELKNNQQKLEELSNGFTDEYVANEIV